FVPPALLEALPEGQREFPSVQVKRDERGVRLGFAGGALTRPIGPRLSDAEQRLQWMGAQGIDRQIVGGWLDMFGYELPPAEGAQWCRFLNQHLLTATAAIDGFVPLACVPLQDGRLAAQVLEESLAAGFHGAMIGTQPKGTRSEEHTSELQSRENLVCRLLLE